uniref:Synaptopodin 2b n=1 Tax=Oryzias melastigma TaxID=30732 RepID=A0A3B3BU06_ORYME
MSSKFIVLCASGHMRPNGVERPQTEPSETVAAPLLFYIDLADMTQVLTPTTKHPPGNSNWSAELSEEGGRKEAPPASVFFGISDEGAEQAESWNSGSGSDLCRPDRNRTRHTSKMSWGRVKEMDALPETRGKGVMMFVQRRKRIDEFVLEQEELRSKEPPMSATKEPQRTEEQNIIDTKKVCAKETKYIGVNPKKHLEHHQDAQQTNNLSNMPKPLVPNRTARPFPGFQAGVNVAEETLQAPKKDEAKFKVSEPLNSNPKVWSPTGDIIASRDERISVPAIKTGILPDSKRKSANKQPPASVQASERQNKGDRRSYIEPEEDCFSLGAEACNFMQPRTIKLKNPPPVAPKPTINPAFSSSPKLPLQPTTNSWSHQPPHSSVSMQASSPSYRPYSPPISKSDSTPNLVASSSSQTEKSYIHVTKASQVSSKVQTSSKGVSQAAGGATMAGKGAQLFAKRQSRMEKFVVDSETVQAHQTRPHSPTLSLPNSWRYSSNIRAPPPLSYNPLLSPFYPPSAAKKPPPINPEVKSKEKPKSAPKQLNALDIMKHQPYQLDSSLFKYDAVPEGKAPSPKPTPASKFEVTKSPPFASTSSQHSSLGDSIASAFSPASLIARGARQMAPRPKFSAKKPVVTGKQSRSLSLSPRLNSAPISSLISPGVQPSFLPTRQTSFQNKVPKPPTPWEAASKSPTGTVDEAFIGLPSSIACNVNEAAHRRSLPEPPEEWKRRVSLDSAAVSRYHPSAPAFQPLSTSWSLSSEKPAMYGPPFRPAQPLRLFSWAGSEYRRKGSSPTK